jgi:hypothetical protein
MDFKSILNKLDSFSAPPKGVDAPKLEQAVQLNEDAQLRVLSGRTTYLSEAKKKKEEEVKEEMKVGDTKKTAKGGTVTKTATGIKHTKKDTYDGEDHQEEPKKKASKAAMTGAERQAQKAKDKEQAKSSKEYAKKNPGSVKKYVDGKLVKEERTEEKDKDGKVTSWKDEGEWKKSTANKDGRGKVTNLSDKARRETEKLSSKKVKEGTKPDFLDIDGDGDKKEPMKKAAADKKKDAPAAKKGMSAKQAKYLGKKESVKESLTFSSALKIVKESQGQFQIDPMDKALWSWAERVGKSKFNESVQAQAFAAATYERMGGEWGLHKVITE